jgi:anti-sigma factor RsiW
MNCSAVLNLLEQRLDGALAPAVEQAVADHLNTCPTCHADWTAAEDLQSLLRDLPVAPARPGFADRVLARAHARVAASDDRAHTGRRIGYGTRRALALAAGLLVVVAAWLGIQAQPDRLPSFAAGSGEPLRLVFRSESALQGVTIALDLPAGTALRGHPGERQIRWQSDLASGTNVLELPLIVDGPGGVLVATLAHAGVTRAFQVRVQPHDTTADTTRDTNKNAPMDAKTDA